MRVDTDDALAFGRRADEQAVEAAHSAAVFVEFDEELAFVHLSFSG